VQIAVDTSSPVPAYEQIRVQVDTMVATGVLPPGTPLPTIRQLAADLGLAAGTVARAYRELESSGMVISRVRHGTVIADAPTRRLPATETRRRLDHAASAYLLAARQLGVPGDKAIEAVRLLVADDQRALRS
jgi:DNA-binding transcriptional regulator YhcF (GntR family)